MVMTRYWILLVTLLISIEAKPPTGAGHTWLLPNVAQVIGFLKCSGAVGACCYANETPVGAAAPSPTVSLNLIVVVVIHQQSQQPLVVNQYRVQNGHSIPRFQLPTANRRHDTSFNSLQVIGRFD